MEDEQKNETSNTNVPDQGGKHDNCEPSHQVRFAFGPDGQFYIHTRSGPVYEYYFKLARHSTKEVHVDSQTCCVAITADGGIFQAVSTCSSSSKSPGPTILYSGPAGPASAFELAYWQLTQKFGTQHLFPLDDQSRANFTLGPRGSYFVVTRDGPHWHNLPEDLAAEIETAKRTPFHVALGVDQTWVCIWEDHTFSWNLRNKYSGLAAKLQAYANIKDTVALVALAPYDDRNSWIMVDCDGVILYSINGPTNQELHQIHSLTVRYMQGQARRTGQTISNMHTWGRGNSAKKEITPYTNFDKPEPLLLRRLLPFSQQLQEMKRHVPYRLRQQDVVVSTAVGCSMAIYCRIFGVKARPALAAGALAGLVTFGAVSQNGLV
ncbi:hypothetical protein N0V93_004328 [Gnomoniopsis smithogilvyi]|uniref:Uncharacterized protein n=1 Tax=Gnomoniopsis smithogilvyi TaxID=1191159 RepID=A0A9W8YTI7_9PEZI|nr:hypothetical protein N0V93_004328 [Gnomoniopsis smithogilvyi]